VAWGCGLIVRGGPLIASTEVQAAEEQVFFLKDLPGDGDFAARSAWGMMLVTGGSGAHRPRQVNPALSIPAWRPCCGCGL